MIGGPPPRAAMQALVQSCARCNISVSTSSPVLSAPTNCLACHIGGGTVLLSWDMSQGNDIDHYIITRATSNTSYPGNLTPAVSGNGCTVDGSKNSAMLHNLPLGSAAFFQIIAVDAFGNKSAPANFTQGVLKKPPIACIVTSIVGSNVPAGCVFSSVTPADRLLGITPTHDLVIQ